MMYNFVLDFDLYYMCRNAVAALLRAWIGFTDQTPYTLWSLVQRHASAYCFSA
jgi:hypothetical protein